MGRRASCSGAAAPGPTPRALPISANTCRQPTGGAASGGCGSCAGRLPSLQAPPKRAPVLRAPHRSAPLAAAARAQTMRRAPGTRRSRRGRARRRVSSPGRKAARAGLPQTVVCVYVWGSCQPGGGIVMRCGGHVRDPAAGARLRCAGRKAAGATTVGRSGSGPRSRSGTWGPTATARRRQVHRWRAPRARARCSGAATAGSGFQSDRVPAPVALAAALWVCPPPSLPEPRLRGRSVEIRSDRSTVHVMWLGNCGSEQSACITSCNSPRP